MTLVQLMTMADYEAVYALWSNCTGMGLNNVDDTKEGIARFLQRNPDTCFKVETDGKLIAAILVGTDGRRGYIYHMAVHPDYRHQGIAKDTVNHACKVLRDMKISKIALVVFHRNISANQFWEKMGFVLREDIAYRNSSLVEMERYDT